MNTSTVVHRLQAPPRARAQARCSLTRANHDGVAVCTGTSTPEVPSVPTAGAGRARAPGPACSADSRGAPAASEAPEASAASAALTSAPGRAAPASTIRPGHHDQSSTASSLATEDIGDWSVAAWRTGQARDRRALGVRCCRPRQSVVEGDIDNLADLHQACIDKMQTWSNSRGHHAQPGHHSHAIFI